MRVSSVEKPLKAGVQSVLLLGTRWIRWASRRVTAACVGLVRNRVALQLLLQRRLEVHQIKLLKIISVDLEQSESNRWAALLRICALSKTHPPTDDSPIFGFFAELYGQLVHAYRTFEQ